MAQSSMCKSEEGLSPAQHATKLEDAIKTFAAAWKRNLSAWQRSRQLLRCFLQAAQRRGQGRNPSSDAQENSSVEDKNGRHRMVWFAVKPLSKQLTRLIQTITVIAFAKKKKH